MWGFARVGFGVQCYKTFFDAIGETSVKIIGKYAASVVNNAKKVYNIGHWPQLQTLDSAVKDFQGQDENL